MKNCEELGSLDKNLILKTKGQVYIRYGQKHIEILDRNGNLNIKMPKTLKQTESIENLSDGFYIYNDELYYSFNREAKKVIEDKEETKEIKLTELLKEFGEPQSGDTIMFDGATWKFFNIEEFRQELKQEILDEINKNNDDSET